MWETIKSLIIKLFGKKTNKTDTEAQVHLAEVAEYEDIGGINITAIASNKLSTLTVSESNVNIVGNNKRAEVLNDIMANCWNDAQDITARVYGTGGVALVPYVSSGKIYTDIVPKDRFFITHAQGTDILAATVLSDVIFRDSKKYLRFTDYTLENGGYVIRSRATVSDSEIPLSTLPEWENIPEEIRIGGVDRLLLAYIKCPCSRGRTDDLYGVPITQGSQEIIKQIDDCLEQVKQEYKKKDAKLFADETLLDKDEKISADLFKMVTAGSRLDEGRAFFEIFDPAFRDTAFYNRLDNLFSLLEKSIGTSRGILTESQTMGATATEIKRSSYDTFALVSAMRKQWEKGADQLVYAYNVLCNAFNIAPAGDYKIKWDWSSSLVESSTESWQQMKDGKSLGVVKAAEVRQWLYPNETLDEAQVVIDDIIENEPSFSQIIGE